MSGDVERIEEGYKVDLEDNHEYFLVAKTEKENTYFSVGIENDKPNSYFYFLKKLEYESDFYMEVESYFFFS